MTSSRILANLGERGLMDEVRSAANARGMSIGELLLDDDHEAGRARHDLWLGLVEQHGFSHDEIALLFERNKATVTKGCREAIERLCDDGETKRRWGG